ncbi:MAG: ribosome silencing factor [Chitinophagaceae bacterium]|nr:ribosome silencing factor [Chitinophagaceae bacterium]
METLELLTQRQKKENKRLKVNSKIIKTIISAIQEKKGQRIVSLDLRKIKEAVADFFILCEADNQPQIKAIAENVERKVNEICGELPYRNEGYQNLKWVLIDYINVVVHIMLPETRRFYQLEELWHDAAQKEYKDS